MHAHTQMHTFPLSMEALGFQTHATAPELYTGPSGSNSDWLWETRNWKPHLHSLQTISAFMGRPILAPFTERKTEVQISQSF